MILLIITLLGGIKPAYSQDSIPRPVASLIRLETGATNARSTYLSPLRYSGTLWGISGEWSKSFQKNPDHVVMTFEGGADFRTMLNPPETARMLGIDARFLWGMAYRLRLPHNLQITAGGMFDIDGGVLYLPRNGNNPVTVLASCGLDLDASLSWRFKIGRIPFILSDRVRIPTLGAFFSPQYGETYYEIYLGNHSGLAHCGWWGNNFGVGNMLSLKIDLGRTAMEIGYRYSYRSYYANHIVTRVASNSFVIGVIPGGMGIKNKKNANYAWY